MNNLIFFILILCALGLYCGKALNQWKGSKSWKMKLEAAAKKALHFTFLGVVSIGLALFVLFAFPFISRIGYAVLSAKTVDMIRSIIDVVFNTRSVYVAIQILAGIMLAAVEFSLIFSVLGFCVAKGLVFLHILEYDRMQKVPEYEPYTEVSIPRTFRKIFLNFANLRI